MTINDYLNTMQTDLYVNGTEREKIRTSINTISYRLEQYFGDSSKCNHKILKKEIFGSYRRDTMLSRCYDDESDIDYMIIFEDIEDYNPQTCLNWLKGFADYWYSTSIVKQSSPTIVIELQNIKFELVPAYIDYFGFIRIPKDSSRWQTTNIKQLNDEMLAINDKYNFKFKKMIRIIKYWNVKKNFRKYKSYDLECFLTEKFKNFACPGESMLNMIDWCFFYLKSYKYVDEYVDNRINNANKLIEEAINYNNIGKNEKAIECIKKVLPET